VKLSDVVETFLYYNASRKTMNKVNDIFTSGDIRYSDPEHEAIVAGFINNNAIVIDREQIKEKRKVNLKNIKGPQKEMKALAIDLLMKNGLKIKGIEIGFGGGIVDVLGAGNEKTIPIECGPCNMRKAIDYLERENTELWIIKPEERGYVLYTIKRSDNWDTMIKKHKSRQIKEIRRAVEKVFS
jgi:hypothetical protein